MTFLRWVARAILLLVISSAMLTWVLLATLQMTLLNRQEVYRWLSASGAYNNLVDSIVNLQPSDGAAAQGSIINNDTVKQAVQQTLPPSFIQQSTQTALDATYDWFEGKNTDIHFNIPLAEKRQEFVNNLASVIQPRIAALPTCGKNISASSSDITCIPPGQTAQQFAQQLAGQSLGASDDFLNAPITPEMVTQSLNLPAATQQSNPFAWLQGWTQMVPALVIWLPIVTLVSGALYVLLTPDKKKGIVTIAQYILFNVIFFVVIGGALWYFGGQIALDDTNVIVSTIIMPTLKQALPAIGMWLTIFSSAVCLVCAAVWIAIAIINHRGKKDKLTLPPRQPEQHLPPVPPSQS